MNTKIDAHGMMSDHVFAMLVAGVLVQRLGGTVVITQSDLDAIAGLGMNEVYTPSTRSLEITVRAPEGVTRN